MARALSWRRVDLRARVERVASRVADAPALLAKWQRILAVRAAVQKELEGCAKQGTIGSSLEADVTIVAGDDDYAALASLDDDLALRAHHLGGACRARRCARHRGQPQRAQQVRALLALARRRRSLDGHPALCGRCVANLFGAGRGPPLRMNDMTRAALVTRRWWLWLAVSALVVAADQVSKALVMASLRPGEERPVTDFFSLVLTFNAGAAFSFLGDATDGSAICSRLIALAASALIVWLLRRGGGTLYCAALTLILGGAIGNLFDRVIIGRVVDFLFFHRFLPTGCRVRH